MTAFAPASFTPGSDTSLLPLPVIAGGRPAERVS